MKPVPEKIEIVVSCLTAVGPHVATATEPVSSFLEGFPVIW